MRKVAIFDIDGTVFRSSLAIELTEALIAEGIFPESARKEYEMQFKKWADREGKYQDYIDAIVKVFMKNIKGVHYADFSRVAEALVSERGKRVYRYTRDLVKELRRKRYFVLAISQSPKTILEGFCKNMGFHKVYGRMYELGPSDRFTGKIIDVHLIENKANIVRRAVKKEGLTLTGSIGVGDTESDIAFLELVDEPICFNPNSKLYRHAKRNNWKIIVERKDVIYELE
ncbi:HAD-IB family hydrolase [Candidatus Kaiserbacteria bacterium CG10_big_fil_rev_8_21_14_0_10_49_17]|uniref:HAD-IB family hydrolase n=1 Tax=Candidatus Kaiserbacteria bacterium CG10_big_fil_rev_8_21_14_0_10_49_17 TaxID=1974609 RepID=A0A2M6WEN7_9BACT|nr:MAG: HAD-IB family hydrolase [Candidatus Kaiserbacteria bacterium CG10_big_fil_rev_8_21_14_0_10_49_17]